VNWPFNAVQAMAQSVRAPRRHFFFFSHSNIAVGPENGVRTIETAAGMIQRHLPHIYD